MTGLIKVENQVTANKAADFENLFAKWLDFAQVKPASVRAYTKGAKNFFAFVKAQGTTNLTREVLLSYREHLGGKYAAATANLYLTATKLFVGFLYQEGLLETNIADRIKNFKVSEQHAKDALSANATKKIIAAFDATLADNLSAAKSDARRAGMTLKSRRDKAIYATMTTCGLRCVEVMRANVADLIMRGDKFFLQVQGKGRDDKAECVEVPAGVHNLIKLYLSERGNVGGNEPLFASVSHRNFGGRLTTTSISRIIKTTLRANGFDSPRLTAHSLRHTCANTMILNGVELRKVQEVLRHRNITVTQRYLHELDRYNNGGESICAAAFGL